MENTNFDNGRSDYWAGGYIRPTIEELKEEGRWNSLPESIKASYLKAKKYRDQHPELESKMKAMAAEMRFRVYAQA